MAAEAAGDEAGASSKLKLTLLDLPAETQREIISHCTQSDLICVALVSKHFHELASSIIYRNFHIIFPDDDDINFDSPIDGLAGGLDTFTTSEYDYARHLKDFSMDTLSSGLKGEHSYHSYLYSSSCGKFLNTLLYLTLKKARSLEAFRWNIRVELSRPVYQELHRIESLRKLHVRMQAGESYYMPPPPLPVAVDHYAGNATTHHWADGPPGSPVLLPVLPLPLSGTPPPLVSGGPPAALVPPSKSLLKNKAIKRGMALADPPTLSGFHNLKSLSLLDIDNVDIVSELRSCLRNSSATLTELQLSFSDSLAMQARKPAPDSDADDSDIDDEFQVVPASQNNSYDVSGPAKAYRAQEERVIQEGVLAKVFDVDILPTSAPIGQDDVEDDKSDSEKNPPDNTVGDQHDLHGSDPREEFMRSIRGVSDKLMARVNGSRDFSASQQDILDTIAEAAKKFVNSREASVKREADGDTATRDASNTAQDPPENGSSSATAAKKSKVTEKSETSSSAKASESSSLLPERDDTSEPEKSSTEKEGTSWAGPKTAWKLPIGKQTTLDSSPEDIDIEHLETMDDISDGPEDDAQEDKPLAEASGPEEQPQEELGPGGTADTASNSEGMDATTVSELVTTMEKSLSLWATQKAKLEGIRSNLSRGKEEHKALVERFRAAQTGENPMTPEAMASAESHLERLSGMFDDMRKSITGSEGEVISTAAKMRAHKREIDKRMAHRDMNNYIRDTRGFSLEALSIHLIPVKASVLSRAINLSSLKQLTLLNVGNQALIWNLLAKENKTNPLALRSVFTDNVTASLLTCLSQLDELHELFLLERALKHKPESFVPRSTITIDQIRRLVLKKHMPTLKRLMIKDESNAPAWDANEKAMILICTRGANLEELAISMNYQAVHAFMQYFAGLTKLRAINILHFKNNDTCIWVMRDIPRFIVDTLSHRPELKLEWIAMEDERVDRVVRPSETSDSESEQRKKKRKNRSNGKAAAVAVPGVMSNDDFPLLPIEALDSDSDSDDSDFEGDSRLRFRTVGPLQFYDAWGVKIFEKEIRSGKL